MCKRSQGQGWGDHQRSTSLWELVTPPGQGPFQRRGPRAISEEGPYLFLKWLLDPLFPGRSFPWAGALFCLDESARPNAGLQAEGPGASRHRLPLPLSQALPVQQVKAACVVWNVLGCSLPMAHPDKGTQLERSPFILKIVNVMCEIGAIWGAIWESPTWGLLQSLSCPRGPRSDSRCSSDHEEGPRTLAPGI